MTPADLRTFCTALGFTAVVMQGNTGKDNAARAQDIAVLIEEFCRTTLPDVFLSEEVAPVARDDAPIDRMIDRFKTELRDNQVASLPQDRETLLRFYDRLQLRQAWRHQKPFYAAAPDDLIANRVLSMIDEELNGDEAGE
jgi:hypothetical protein